LMKGNLKGAVRKKGKSNHYRIYWA
jgi:hypothetical protein